MNFSVESQKPPANTSAYFKLIFQAVICGIIRIFFAVLRQEFKSIKYGGKIINLGGFKKEKFETRTSFPGALINRQKHILWSLYVIHLSPFVLNR